MTQKIYTLSKKKFSEQGASHRDAYKALVEESIQYYLGQGELTDDDNLEFIEDQVLDLWPQMQEEISA